MFLIYQHKIPKVQRAFSGGSVDISIMPALFFPTYALTRAIDRVFLRQKQHQFQLRARWVFIYF